ncbi:MAG: hypothetical protein KAH01_00310 [Caldisericia bacterium]|nr:hypothetical protein [Caldisericia bacterium]
MKNFINKLFGTVRTSLPTAKASGTEIEILLDKYGRSATYSYDGLEAARDGRAFIMKGDGIDTLSGGVVQTTAGMFKAIPAGQAAVVKGFMLHLHTASDEVEMVIGYTADADATGTFVGVSPSIHIETGNAVVGAGTSFVTLPVPMYLKYSATCKAVAIKLTANDDAAEALFGIAGWLEEIF